MTTPDTPSQLDQDLAAAVSDSDPAAAVQALAGHDLVLPQNSAPEPSGGQVQITLPVIEQDQTSYVPAFTTSERLTESLPSVPSSIVVSASELASAWPSDDLWLVVNPGDATTGVALPAAAVRTLATV